MIFLFHLSEVPKYIMLDWAMWNSVISLRNLTVDIDLFMSINTSKKCY